MSMVEGPRPTREQYNNTQTTTANNNTGTDINSLLVGGGGAQQGTGDVTSIVTGGQHTNTDAYQADSAANINDIYNLLGGNNLEAMFGAQRNDLINRYGITQGYHDQSRDAMQTEADLAMRGLGLDRAALGIGQDAASRDLSAIQQLLGINDSSLQRNLASVRNLLGLNSQNLGNQISGINLSEDASRRQFADDATSRGAFNAPGTRRTFTDIEREAGLARRAAKIGAAQTTQGLNDRGGTQIEEHAKTRIGLNQRAGDVGDTLRRLDIESKRLGLTGEQIQNSLDQGLARLGLDQMTSTADLIDRLNSTSVEQSTMAANLLAQAAGMAGMPGIADILGGDTVDTGSNNTANPGTRVMEGAF